MGHLAAFAFTHMSDKEWFVKSAKIWTMYDENDGEENVFDILKGAKYELSATSSKNRA